MESSSDITALRCITCGVEYRPGELDYTCPTCGSQRGTLEVLYDYTKIAEHLSKASLRGCQDRTLWRYLPILPVGDAHTRPSLEVGYTPLYRSDELAAEFGAKEVYIKDDGRNPTASYKDRASAIAVVKAQESGAKVITCASTGNAASSLAGFSANTKLRAVIFIPQTAPEAKIAQLLIYGAIVFAVEGSYDEAFDLCSQVAEKYGWYNRSSAINPYLVEGKKTGALEIAEQLDWQVPDKVLVPVGDGSIISAVYKGFYDLVQLKFIDAIPQVIGVQARGANPIQRAFERYQGGEVHMEEIEPDTVADSIAVGKPRDIIKAVKYVDRCHGYYISISDHEILEAIKELARRTGVFAEPAGAIGYAGLRRLADEGKIDRGDRVVVMVTGNGLKDVAAAREAAGSPQVVKPRLSEIERLIEPTFKRSF